MITIKYKIFSRKKDIYLKIRNYLHITMKER